MRRKVAVLLLSILQILSIIVIIVDLAPYVAAPSVIYVDDVPGSGPGNPAENYTRIWDAVSVAQNGDTIFVYNGTYNEWVNLNKKINLVGENKNTTIINHDNADVVAISANGANISGFSIVGNVNNWDAGIRCNSVSNVHINNNIVTNNKYGIWLSFSSSVNITECDIHSNTNMGIYVDHSNNNIIEYNNITSNNYGMYVYFSSFTSVSNNDLTENGFVIYSDSYTHWDTTILETSNTVNGKPVYYLKNQNGGSAPLNAGQLILFNCSNVLVENQNINNGTIGIHLAFSENNTITMNDLAYNNVSGIYLYHSHGNEFKNNNLSGNNCGFTIEWSHLNKIVNSTISNGTSGIYSYQSNGNKIINNNISNNSIGINILSAGGFGVKGFNISHNNLYKNNYGVKIDGNSFNNYIYHNRFVNNTNQSVDETLPNRNLWDLGYPLGGNFWSDYNGSDFYKGPNQNISGDDGLGDTPYIIYCDIIDRYPLIIPNLDRSFENFTILKPGWNLISIPLIQNDQNLTKVLEMIDGWYDEVRWYDKNDMNDPWKNYIAGKPFGNDLSQISEKKGFWIHITNPGDSIFLYNGSLPATNQTIQLIKGWNLVGFPSLASYNRSLGLNNLQFGIDVDAIQWFGASTRTWHFLEEGDLFVPGRGYWMHSLVDAVWDVPL
jgi:parallel beta-helix repeat protein